MLKKGILLILALIFSSGILFAEKKDISKMSDDEFLKMIEKDSFRYYLDRTHPKSGLISQPDGTTHIGSNGFALNAMVIAAENKFISREDAAERTLKILDTFLNKASQHKGVFLWITNYDATKSAATPNHDMVETAYICAGALIAKQYFHGKSDTEKLIREYADKIYRRVDFKEFQKDSKGEYKNTLAWHYDYEKDEYTNFRIRGYNECMIIYIMALGSPTHPADPETWDGWAGGYSWENVYGYEYFVCGSMFTHQYTQCWADLRGIQDKYTKRKNTTYFENSRRAALSHLAYAKDNPKGFPGYGKIWGLTDCGCPLHGSASGFGEHGVPTRTWGDYFKDDGTVAISAAGASIMFTPKESIGFLRYVYENYGDKIYDKHGFKNAFNLKENWFDKKHDILNKGAMLSAIENYRSGLIWKMFMKNPEIKEALKKAGFKKGKIKKNIKTEKYPVSVMLDDMETKDNWEEDKDKEAKMKSEIVQSPEGNAIKIEYNFDDGLWINMLGLKKYDLSEYKALKIKLKSSDFKNAIEFKLTDDDNSVFGIYIYLPVDKINKWTEEIIEIDEFAYWWLGDGKLDLKNALISIAVGKRTGKKGDEYTLEVESIEALK